MKHVLIAVVVYLGLRLLIPREYGDTVLMILGGYYTLTLLEKLSQKVLGDSGK